MKNQQERVIHMKTIPEVKQFPKGGFDQSQLDVMDIRKVYFTGLYERTVTLSDGTQRTYKAYIPENAHYGDDSTYVAVPDGVDTVRFLVESGWLDGMEKEENSCILFAMEPAGKAWGAAETEKEYVGKVFDDANNKMGGGFRNLVFTSDFNWRWAGYGRGGEMVMRYLLENPMLAASAAIEGDLKGIGQETLDAAGKICFTNGKGHTYTEWPNRKIPVPMWLIGCENQALIDYLKSANECTKSLELADGILYQQNPMSANLITYDQKVGQVMVTKKSVSAEKMVEFIRSFSRCGMNSPYGNMLYPTTEDSFFPRDTVISDGMQREWYIHVPACYDAAKPMPLVIYFHGHGQTGLIGMRQGGWWQHGEERGFITVCPTGSLPKRDDDQLPLIGWHTGLIAKRLGSLMDNRRWLEDEDRFLEYRFILAMLDKLYTQYNIDKTRIYVTGQSNGGFMTQMMCEMGENIFAAAASTGVPTQIAHSTVPDFAMGGEFDLMPVTLTADHQMQQETARKDYREALAYRNINADSAGYFRNGIFENLLWQDEAGTPVCRFCVVNSQAHSWRQNVCKMFWDEWFCRYSRDPETGKILYMGK